MKKRICVITTSRADYYLLSLLCKKIKKSKKLELNLIVSGDHFSIKKGNSFKDIKRDGLKIRKKIPMDLSSDKKKNIMWGISKLCKDFTLAFKNIKPDLIMVLGDRFELFAPTITAVQLRVPIAHIHGGELTLGAIDDIVRHSLTKMSNLHFVSNKIYRNRVIQLGENPKYVYDVGGIGAEIIKYEKLLTKKQLRKELNLNLNKKIILVTCHPETINSKINYNALFKCLKNFSEKYSIIFTSPNSDFGNSKIEKLIVKFLRSYPGYLFNNLGRKKYLSVLKYSEVLVGNSSSGILEAPNLKTFTLNIGERQKGRLFSKSIFSCDFSERSIKKQLKKILFINNKNKFFLNNKYYRSNHASDKIINILGKIDQKKIMKKRFYDLQADTIK